MKRFRFGRLNPEHSVMSILYVLPQLIRFNTYMIAAAVNGLRN